VNPEPEIKPEDIRPGGRLYARLLIASLTDREWQAVKQAIISEIRTTGVCPQPWRDIFRGALSDE